MKWLLVGWDNEPRAEIVGFACALPASLIAAFTRCSQLILVPVCRAAGMCLQLSAGCYLDEPFLYPATPKQISEAKSLCGALRGVDGAKQPWGLACALQAGAGVVAPAVHLTFNICPGPLRAIKPSWPGLHPLPRGPAGLPGEVGAAPRLRLHAGLRLHQR